MTFPKYPEYKDSGVEWLGEVPVHWDIFPIKRDLDFLTSGSRGWASHYADDGAAFIRIGNLTRDHIHLDLTDLQRVNVPEGSEGERTKVKPGDVLFSITAYLGSVAVVPDDIDAAYVSQHVALARFFKRRLLPGWIAYVTLSDVGKNYLSSQGYGGTKIQLSLEDVADLLVTAPPLCEQASITSFLDHETARIDALVEEQKRLIELLKEKRQAVISHAVTKGLDPDVPMKDSGVEWLGEVPAHWRIGALKHTLEVVADVDHFMPSTVSAGIPYVMTGDLRRLASEIDLESCKQIAREDFLKLSRKIRTSKGDVIMARYATIGTVSYVDIDSEFVVSYSCVTIRPRVNLATGMYLFFYFQSDSFVQGVSRMINANTQGNVGVGDLKEVEIALPDIHEQEAIVHELEIRLAKLDRVAVNSKATIDLLKERRSALISAAVTGKIDVRGWQPPAGSSTPVETTQTEAV